MLCKVEVKAAVVLKRLELVSTVLCYQGWGDEPDKLKTNSVCLMHNNIQDRLNIPRDSDGPSLIPATLALADADLCSCAVFS